MPYVDSAREAWETAYAVYVYLVVTAAALVSAELLFRTSIGAPDATPLEYGFVLGLFAGVGVATLFLVVYVARGRGFHERLSLVLAPFVAAGFAPVVVGAVDVGLLDPVLHALDAPGVEHPLRGVAESWPRYPPSAGFWFVLTGYSIVLGHAVRKLRRGSKRQPDS